MTKEEEKAIECIDKYFKVVFNGHNKVQDDFEYGRAKKSAQLECQSIIDELEYIGGYKVADSYFKIRITFYKGVIKAIEQQ